MNINNIINKFLKKKRIWVATSDSDTMQIVAKEVRSGQVTRLNSDDIKAAKIPLFQGADEIVLTLNAAELINICSKLGINLPVAFVCMQHDFLRITGDIEATSLPQLLKYYKIPYKPLTSEHDLAMELDYLVKLFNRLYSDPSDLPHIFSFADDPSVHTNYMLQSNGLPVRNPDFAKEILCMSPDALNELPLRMKTNEMLCQIVGMNDTIDQLLHFKPWISSINAARFYSALAEKGLNNRGPINIVNFLSDIQAKKYVLSDDNRLRLRNLFVELSGWLPLWQELIAAPQECHSFLLYFWPKILHKLELPFYQRVSLLANTATFKVCGILPDIGILVEGPCLYDPNSSEMIREITSMLEKITNILLNGGVTCSDKDKHEQKVMVTEYPCVFPHYEELIANSMRFVQPNSTH
jgi:hypothetical protein